MVEPTKRHVDQAVQDSINLFRRAQVGEVAPVEPRIPKAILLAVDGSTQDGSGLALAGGLRRRTGCELFVVDAREETGSNALAEKAAESLQASVMEKSPGTSFEQILGAAAACGCDLVLGPCPYGRDLESVGPDSVGTVADVLLARCPVPILLVRKPFRPEAEPFAGVWLVLTSENEAAPGAAAWATGMVAVRGKLRMMLVLDKESRENIQAMIQAIAPQVDVSSEALSRALATTHVRLHRGLQKAAERLGFDYTLTIQREEDSGPAALEDQGARALLVLALERSDRASQGHVQSRVRRSSDPVLVVPVG